MILQVFIVIFAFSQLIAAHPAHPPSSLIIQTRSICQLFRHTKFMCFPDDFSVRVDLKSTYASLTFKPTSNLLELKCSQKYVINSNTFDNFPLLNFTEITQLNVHGCSIGDSNFFMIFTKKLNLTKIQDLTLDIRIEKHKWFSREIFENSFKSVQRLKLHTYSGHTFAVDSFRPFEMLTTLSLHVVDLMEPQLPVKLFDELKMLKYLTISSTSHLKEPKEGQKVLNLVVSDVVNLVSFEVSGIRWPLVLNLKLPRFLTRISLKNNKKLRKLDEGAFRKNEQLEYMDLSNNSLAEIHSKVFYNQTSLEFIDLSHNRLRNLSSTIFERNTILNEINLSFNQLVTLGIEAFANLEGLHTLNLHNNNLTVLHLSDNFRGATELEILTLNNNKIAKIEQNLPSTHLKELNLVNNNISHFEIALWWQKTDNLEIFLAENPIESLNFKSIDENAINENQTLTIDVGILPIKCNCETTNFYEFLHKKIFVKNETYEKIKIVPEEVKCKQSFDDAIVNVRDMTHKTFCFLDTKHQVVCPSSCRCIRRPALKMLLIRCSNITTVPDLPPYNLVEAFKTFELDIQGNGLTALPSIFSSGAYNNVTEVNASFNSIARLDVDNFPRNLSSIDLRHNLLTKIDDEILAKFANLNSILLSGNFWNCSEAKNLIEFVKKNRKIVADLNQMRCGSSVDGIFLLEFDIESSCVNYVYLILSVGAGVIVMITGIYVSCKYQKEISEWIFVNDKRHLVEQANDILMPRKFDVCMVFTVYDQVMAKFLSDRLKSKSFDFKCAFVTKNWPAEDKIPSVVLKTFRNSRRVVVILSEYFHEENWNNWSYPIINSRLILIVKGSTGGLASEIELSNKMVVKFSEPWFWDKLRFMIKHRRELEIEEEEHDEGQEVIEMQPIRFT